MTLSRLAISLLFSDQIKFSIKLRNMLQQGSLYFPGYIPWTRNLTCTFKFEIVNKFKICR